MKGGVGLSKRSSAETALLLGALVFYLYIAWSVPYSTTDDLQWGMDQGLRWWLQGSLNSRYVGNFFAVAMCHSPLVKTLIMGLTMFAIPLLMARLAARGEGRSLLPIYLASSAGLLLMPPVMWQETYAWVSGFGNYVVPTLLFLVWLLLVRRVVDRGGHRLLWAVLFLALEVVMGLFVENLTLLFLGAALLTALCSLGNKSARLPLWAGFLGSALAAAIIFGGGSFSQLLLEGSALNGLRDLTFDWSGGLPAALTGILEQYFVRLLPISFLRGPHIALPSAVILALGFWNSRLRPLALLGLLPLGYHGLLLQTEEYDTPVRVAVSALIWALVLLAPLVQRTEPSVKLGRFLLCLAAPLSLLPLAATTTLGQRLYFFPMAMLILTAADMAAPLLARWPVQLLTSGALAALMICWGWMHWTVLGCTTLREELTSQAVEQGNDTLILPTDRYERVVWHTRNPWNVEYADYYRQFYHIPDQVTLVILPAGSYECWPDVDPEQWERRLEFFPSKDYTPSLP